jgi:hypothetical protein
MAGYSGTPLPQKLGVKPGHRVCLVNAPPGFEEASGLGGASGLGPVTVVTRLAGTCDVIVLFAKSRADLEKRFATARAHLDQAGGLWIAWPKKASGVATDVTENVVREIALASGLVDNKVCAIDEVWSGLRCVVRVKDRK